MFTEKKQDGRMRVAGGRRGRGRPRGPTKQGQRARQRLYRTAIQLIGARGFESTTLREVASRAGVSVGLLYRYFPSKRAVVLALYDDLSAEFAAQAAHLRPGPWRERSLAALKTSLRVLRPHRRTLAGLVPALVSSGEDGLFASGTAFSRRRVQGVFEEAVRGAIDAPAPEMAGALGRMLYLAHLAVIFGWLLDRSRGQRATRSLVALLERGLPVFSLAVGLSPAATALVNLDALLREALFEDGAV